MQNFLSSLLKAFTEKFPTSSPDAYPQQLKILYMDLNSVKLSMRIGSLTTDTDQPLTSFEIPTNTDELYNVLKSFKEDDPNQNGERDEIPLSGIDTKTYNSVVPFIMSAFIVDDGINRLMVEDGKIDIIARKDEFREGLTYLNKLYEEGLIDQESFTQNREIRTSKGETGVLGMAPGNAPHMFTVIGSEETREFNPMGPITGPSGLKATAKFVPNIKGGRFVITDKCKNPEVAMRWVDALFSEDIYFDAVSGREGIGYRKAEQGEVGSDGNQAIYAYIIPRGNLQNEFWVSPPGYCARWMVTGAVASDDIFSTEGFPRRYMDATKLYDGLELEEKVPNRMYFLSDDVDQVSELETTIQNYINESIARFIVGDLSLESDWDTYVSTLEGMRLDEYLGIYQRSYDAVWTDAKW